MSLRSHHFVHSMIDSRSVIQSKRNRKDEKTGEVSFWLKELTPTNTSVFLSFWCKTISEHIQTGAILISTSQGPRGAKYSTKICSYLEIPFQVSAWCANTCFPLAKDGYWAKAARAARFTQYSREVTIGPCSPYFSSDILLIRDVTAVVFATRKIVLTYFLDRIPS